MVVRGYCLLSFLLLAFLDWQEDFHLVGSVAPPVLMMLRSGYAAHVFRSCEVNICSERISDD